MNINWDALKEASAKVLVAGGSVSATLISVFGLSQDDANHDVAVAGLVVSALCVIGPSITSILRRTDKGKAKDIGRLDEKGLTAVAAQMTAPQQAAVVKAVTETPPKAG